MKIEITVIEPCRLSVHCEANFIEIGNKKEEVLNAFKKAPVKGFRNGKASMDAIKMHYGKQIDEALKRALAEDSYHEAIFQNKLRPHGAPRFTNLLLDGGKFTCEFEMLTRPDFELPDWKSFEIPKPHEIHNVTAITEQMIQELRVRLGDATPYTETDFVQTGDDIIIDYEGTVDGQKVDSLTVEGEMMTVGKSPLQGFDSNLLGMTIGETREFDFVAPEGGLPSLAGKVVHFKVVLMLGSKTVPCSLDDELATRMGKKDFQELQGMVSETAFARVESFAKMQLHEAVAKRLVAETKIAVPNWMSLSEAQYLAQQSQLDWNTTSDVDKERMIEMAEQNVKLSLILDKVREVEPEAQLSDQEVFDIIKQNMARTKANTDLDEAMEKMNKTGYLAILMSRIKDEQALDVITKTIKVVE